jgi:hemoglobin/transferrin/lactoferrin receptor protein
MHQRATPWVAALLLASGHGLATDNQATTAQAIDEIIVTSTRVARSDVATTLPIGVVTRNEIEQRMARDIGDLLRDVPGVTTTGGPRAAAMQPNVRGMDAGRVVMRLDGARHNFQTSHRARMFIDPALLERVEVMRGPASTLYGSGATGGVVNMRTLDARGFLGAERSAGARLTSGYQHNGDRRSGAASIAGRIGDAGMLASLSRMRADDFKDGAGARVPLSAVDTLGALLKGSWNLHEHGQAALTHVMYRDAGASLNTPDRATGTLVDSNTRQGSTTFNYRFGSSASRRWDGEATLYYSKVELSDRSREADSVIDHDVITRGVDLQNTSRLDWGGFQHELTYGGEYYRDEQTGTENGVPRLQFADARQRIGGLFVQSRSELGERTEWTLGLRNDRLRQRAERAGIEPTSMSSTSLMVSGAYALTSTIRVRASYAEAFRAPSLRELYIGGQHFPGNAYIPNPALRPETAHNVEVGAQYLRRDWHQVADQLSIRMTVFQNEVTDYINQVVNGAAGTTQFENVDDARIRGVEASMAYRAPRYRLAASVAALRGDDRGTGRPLESIAADRAVIDGAYRWQRGKFETGARIEINRDQDRLWVGPHTRATTPGYTVVDLYAMWQPTTRVRIDAAIDNVFDETYRHHLAFINGRGRTARMQFSYQL